MSPFFVKWKMGITIERILLGGSALVNNNNIDDDDDDDDDDFSAAGSIRLRVQRLLQAARGSAGASRRVHRRQNVRKGLHPAVYVPQHRRIVMTDAVLPCRQVRRPRARRCCFVWFSNEIEPSAGSDRPWCLVLPIVVTWTSTWISSSRREKLCTRCLNKKNDGQLWFPKWFYGSSLDFAKTNVGSAPEIGPRPERWI